MFQSELLRLYVPTNEKGVDYMENLVILFCESLYFYCIEKRMYQKLKTLKNGIPVVTVL